MATLEPWVEELEVYSIDEAFGRLHRAASSDLSAWGLALRRQVRRHLGLPVAVGIAPSKVLAKLANKLAKQDPCHGGVFDLGAVADPDPWLAAVAIEDVWGHRPQALALVPPARRGQCAAAARAGQR